MVVVSKLSRLISQIILLFFNLLIFSVLMACLNEVRKGFRLLVFSPTNRLKCWKGDFLAQMTSVIIIMIIFLIQLFKCELTLPASEASSQCESTLKKTKPKLCAFKCL